MKLMRALGSLEASGAALLLLVMAGLTWPAVDAQSLVSQVTLGAQGTSAYGPKGAGYAKGYAYFCAGSSDYPNYGAVWKVATGNSNGPSSAAPYEINSIPLSKTCDDGVVDKDGIGYWVGRSPLFIAKTDGNTGDDPMTLVGEYTVSDATGGAYSVALDSVNNMLFVGSYSAIWKIDANNPSLVDSLYLEDEEGTYVYGLAVDPATGYGYGGTGFDATSIIKFSLGAGTNAMTRISRVDTLDGVRDVTLNPLTGALYVGYNGQYGSVVVDMGMVLPGEGNAPPSYVGSITFNGAAANAGVRTNKALVINPGCDILFGGAYSEPGFVDLYNMNNGKVLPTYQGDVELPTNEVTAGAIDEYGYAYYATRDEEPPVIYKISNPQCNSPYGGPFTLKGAKTPAKGSAKAGGSIKLTFTLTRLSEGYAAPDYPPVPGNRVENYNVFVVLPEQGVTLKGKPRVYPAIPKRKGADVATNTRVAWTAVPMKVQPGYHKSYTRKFTVVVRVDKTFVGSNLTFNAAAVGPQDFWVRTTSLTVPVVAAKK